MYRLQVIATVTRERKKGRKIVSEQITAAWDDFNTDERIAKKMGRPGFGSFHYETLRDAFRRARVILKTDARVTSVQIRGMQDQMVGRVWPKHAAMRAETPLLAIVRLRQAA